MEIQISKQEIKSGFAVCIIDGAENTASSWFRTEPIKRALEKTGAKSQIYSLNDQNINIDVFDVIVLVRVAAGEYIDKIIKRAHVFGIPVVSDFDDLVFRPELIDKIDGVRFLTADEIEKYRQGMGLYQDTVRRSDMVMVTTDSLKKQVERYNKNCVVVKNYPLPSARVAASEINLANKNKNFTIGYYSGTLTHQADFKKCVKSISKFMQLHHDSVLKIAGKFDTSEFKELEFLSDRIVKVPFMSYGAMIKDMAQCDVVLAPLECGNEFCEAKSELKYFDAGLVRVPLIASPTEVFKKIIRNRENGYLAETEKEWIDALENEYSSKKTLSEVGKRAFRDVISFYGENAQTKAYSIISKLINTVNSDFSRKEMSNELYKDISVKSKKVKLGVLLPDIMIGSGGHRKALAFCKEYSQLGGKVEIAFISEKSDEELQQIVNDYYFSDCGQIRAFGGRAIDCDVAVATSWPTSYEVVKWEKSKKKFYFVQDFEALFSPMSTDYVKAYHSYKLGLTPVCFGKWNREKIKREFGLESGVIPFPVDHDVYYPRVESKSNIILFYARPSQPRRLFELGFEALKIASEKYPGLTVILFGEEVNWPMPDNFLSLGRVTNLNRLAYLYSLASLGIAFSTTNPSLMPFEMLACGLPVLDVDLGYSNEDFMGCSSIVYSDPTEVSLAEKIIATLENRDKLNSMRVSALEWAKNLKSEREFAIQVLEEFGLLERSNIEALSGLK